MRVYIIGGGITGQLVQWLVPQAEILDWRPETQASKLTRQYGANYLWEPIEGLAMRSFPVRTEIDGLPPTPDAIQAYKAKVGKADETDDHRLQFASETTGFEFADGALPTPSIQWDCHITAVDALRQRVFLRDKRVLHYDVLVTTIPQYAFYQMVRESDPNIWRVSPFWRWKSIYVRVTQTPPDAPYRGQDTVYVNYLTRDRTPVYRTTDRHGERHYESLDDQFGFPTRKLIPGKIYHNDHAMQVAASWEVFNIFSFGRYATWDTNELVHQTVKNIRTKLLPRLTS